jgi:hypothetical protein
MGLRAMKRSTTDPHGYGRLRDLLADVEEALAATHNNREASLVHRAVLFYGGGSPSEFLGESRVALEATLASARDLPVELVSRIRAIIAEIDEGFRAVGGG